MSAIERIGSESKRELLELLKRQGGLTLNEAVAATELARTTLREHLGQLERDGLVTSSRRREGRGRPELEFELTPAGQSLFPNQSGKMLGRLIDFLRSTGGEEYLETFFREYWQERLETARFRMRNVKDETEAALNELARLLEEEGFMPEIDRDEVEDETSRFVTVRECNCPFPEAVRETKLPCELEVQFYENLFDERVERVGYIPDGDAACTYRIATRSPDSTHSPDS
jgi:predicted ArsR family transcriptional regulator